MVKKRGFSKEEHIRITADFRKVYDTGKSFACEYAVMYVLDRKDGGIPRIGWSLNRKLGKANLRFRMKRYIREVYRLNKEKIKPGIDIIILPRKKAADIKKYHDMEKILLDFWKEKRVIG